MDLAATVARVAPVVEAAADSVETAADSAEAAAASALLVGKCSTRCAPSVARKRKFPSSPAAHAPFIAGIASRPTARHVVAVVAVADSAAVAADSVVAVATVVVAATAVPAVTNPAPLP